MEAYQTVYLSTTSSVNWDKSKQTTKYDSVIGYLANISNNYSAIVTIPSLLGIIKVAVTTEHAKKILKKRCNSLELEIIKMMGDYPSLLGCQSQSLYWKSIRIKRKVGLQNNTSMIPTSGKPTRSRIEMSVEAHIL